MIVSTSSTLKSTPARSSKLARLPWIYLLICELLAAIYEAGLAFHDGIGYSIVAAILLLFATAPISFTMANHVKVFAADILGYTSHNAHGVSMLNSFWPREISIQFSILVCFAALWGIVKLGHCFDASDK